jgi:hypothetical protein
VYGRGDADSVRTGGPEADAGRTTEDEGVLSGEVQRQPLVITPAADLKDVGPSASTAGWRP